MECSGMQVEGESTLDKEGRIEALCEVEDDDLLIMRNAGEKNEFYVVNSRESART